MASGMSSQSPSSLSNIRRCADTVLQAEGDVSGNGERWRKPRLSAALGTLGLLLLYLLHPLPQLQQDFKWTPVRVNAETDETPILADFKQQILLVLARPGPASRRVWFHLLGHVG